MANYHLSTKIISRSKGQSVVAAAAYRACVELKDETIDKTFDYSKKKDNEFSMIILPQGAPVWLSDRAKLWNEVENVEKRKDAQLGREVEVSLPLEFNLDQNIKLITEFVNNNFVNKGMIADINIHNKDGNPHAHVLLTLRDVDQSGFGQKNRSWNNKTLLHEWRKDWATIQNQHLNKAGFDITVDHRSYVDQGIDLEPQIHIGPLIHIDGQSVDDPGHLDNTEIDIHTDQPAVDQADYWVQMETDTRPIKPVIDRPDFPAPEESNNQIIQPEIVYPGSQPSEETDIHTDKPAVDLPDYSVEEETDTPSIKPEIDYPGSQPSEETDIHTDQTDYPLPDTTDNQETSSPNATWQYDRVVEYNRISNENGIRIINDPSIAINHLASQNAVFTEYDILKCANLYSYGQKQFDAVRDAILGHDELIFLGTDDNNIKRYTSNDMLISEKKMYYRVNKSNSKRKHKVKSKYQKQAASLRTMTNDQLDVYHGVLNGNDISCIEGVAGAGKSYVLGALNDAFEAQGYNVIGGAISGIATESLQNGTGINSKTITRLLWEWSHNRSKLTKNDILVIDEAGMIGTKQMHQIIRYVNKAGAKGIFCGDREQIQSIASGGSFRGIVDEIGAYRLSNVMRQDADWQKSATVDLSSPFRADVLNGLSAYIDHGKIHFQHSLSDAKEKLITDWSESITIFKDQSHIILAFKNDDVDELNLMARNQMKSLGLLGEKSFQFKTQEKKSNKDPFKDRKNKNFQYESEEGVIELSVNDRIMFTKNERGGIKNGTLATVLSIKGNSIVVQTDNEDRFVFDIKKYNHIKYGYAATLNKTQGLNIDRSFICATSHFDKHTSYVGLSRHKYDTNLYAGISTDQNENGCFESLTHFKETLSQQRYKNLINDYAYLRNIEPRESRIVDINQIINKQTLSDEDISNILKYLTRQNSVFNEYSIKKFGGDYGYDDERIDSLKHSILNHPEVTHVGVNYSGQPIYSTLDIINKESNLFRNADELNSTNSIKLDPEKVNQVIASYTMTSDQLNAFNDVVFGNNLSSIVGYAGTGKSYLLGAINEAYSEQGYDILGCALSGIAAKNLQVDSGIHSTSIYKLLRDINQGNKFLSDKTIIVVDEAGLVGTDQMEQLTRCAADYGSKIILAGDYQQLQAIAYGAPFKGICDRYGSSTLTTIRRQGKDWQKQATIELSGTEREVQKALVRYMDNGNIKFLHHHDDAIHSMLQDWKAGVFEEPEKTHHMFAFTRDVVDRLNLEGRQFMIDQGLIGQSYTYITQENDNDNSKMHLDDELIHSQVKKERDFGPGDRLMFLRNDVGLGVKNGSISTVERLNENEIIVKLDDSGKTVSFSPKLYNEFTYGYASTIHKTQGVTVDKSYVHASKSFDKHLTLVSLTRHKDDVSMYTSLDHKGFKNKEVFLKGVSRERLKDLAIDYAQQEMTVEEKVFTPKEETLKSKTVVKTMEEIKMNAQELIKEAKEIHTNIKQDGKGGFMQAMRDIQSGMSIGSRNDELERFKTEINLSEYAAHKGYAYDRKESYSNVIVMRNENEKINISRDQDGHWVYKSWSSGKGGSVIDFVQNNDLKSLGEVRKELRPWIGEPEFKPVVPETLYQRTVQPVKKDRAAVLTEMGRAVETNDHPYLKSRGIDGIDPRFQGKVCTDSYKNAVFPHIDREGVCCLEKRNYEFKGMSKGGDKGLWVSHTYKHDTRLVITEAPIDALSYHVINQDDKTRYISFGGRMNDKQQELLRSAINRMPDNSVIIIATDIGKEGEEFAREIAAMSENKTHRIVRDAPEIGKDWNEQLQQVKGIKQIKKGNEKDLGISM